VHDHTPLFQHVALGRATVTLPESSRVHLREDLVAIPVLDGPTITTVIAWPFHSRAVTVQYAKELSGTGIMINNACPVTWRPS